MLSVQIGVGSPLVWTDVYVLDSTQISRAKWIQSPAIDLNRWMPTGASQVEAKIRLVFNSIGQNNEVSLRGIGISEVTISQRSETVLQEIAYDETFSIPDNQARGKPTRILDYDEATRAPIFTRELHYAAPNGRLSDERLTFDWDRSGTPMILGTAYTYDKRGDLTGQKMPYASGTATRTYGYIREHGSVVGATVKDGAFGARNVLGSEWGPGVEYHDAGNMKLVRFANRMQQHIDTNAGSLVGRMWVDRDGWGDTLWDTGTYAYDGARNIKQIGGDYFRYDAAARLTWSRTISSLYGTVDLDQQYDEFGNMTAQNGPAGLPNGSTFSGRTYGVTTNRIESGGVSYDAAGRLKLETGSPDQFYDHGPTGDLTLVSNGVGTWFQQAQYEGDGHRWCRSLSAEGGKALVTLRDASGQVVADYAEPSSTSGLQLQKEYIRVNGQLVAINSTCGPRPLLALSSPAIVDGQVWFDKTDYVPAVGSYTIVIKDSWGQTNTLYRPSNLSNHFGIPLSAFFEGQSNEIQIETDAECGHTGYSNAVVFGHLQAPSSPSCLTSVGVSRSGFNGTGSNLTVRADGDCDFGTTYNIHYQPWYNELEDITLNQGAPELQPLVTVVNIPCDSGEGYYWATPISGGEEGAPSPEIYAGPSTCGVGGGGGVIQSNSNLQFVHWDHLGSTRLVTDEQGAVIASSKFFPFGIEAESSGGDELRQKFTGHERDDRVGLDYMMGRNCRMALARFLEPDPYAGSAHPESPQTWNRYAYVWNNPINATDPSGYAGALVTALCGTNNSCDRPGVNGGNDPVAGPGRNGADPTRGTPSESTSSDSSSKSTLSSTSDPKQETAGGFEVRVVEQASVVNLVRFAGALRGLPFVVRFMPWLATSGGFIAPQVSRNAQGFLSNGLYRLSPSAMAPHVSGTLTGGKSQFLSKIDASRAVLDAAAFADKANLWVGNQAKVFVQNGPIGVLARSGQLTHWINVYRTQTRMVHGSPGGAP